MAESFAAVEIIAAKRDALELSDSQIDWLLMLIPAAPSKMNRCQHF